MKALGGIGTDFAVWVPADLPVGEAQAPSIVVAAGREPSAPGERPNTGGSDSVTTTAPSTVAIGSTLMTYKKSAGGSHTQPEPAVQSTPFDPLADFRSASHRGLHASASLAPENQPIGATEADGAADAQRSMLLDCVEVVGSPAWSRADATVAKIAARRI